MVSPLKITAIGCSVCSPQWSSHTELRVPYFRIYYIDGGEGAVTLCGKNYKMEPEFIYFIPGGKPFINHCPKLMSVRWLHGIPTEPRLESMLSQIDVVLKWRYMEFATLSDTFQQFESMAFDAFDSRWFSIQSMVYCVMSKVLAHIEKRVAMVAFPASIKSALDFINSEFTQNPPLKKIARYAHYAPVYFHRVFKQYFGISPHEYMEQKRMSLAQDLLLHSSKTMAEIAELSGYRNVFYFSRVFKKHFATSPGIARRCKMMP